MAVRPAPDPIDEAELLSITAVRFVRVQGKVLGDLAEPLTYPQFITLARIGEGHRSIVALAGLGRLMASPEADAPTRA